MECFFFVEQSDDPNGIIRAMCIECKNKQKKGFSAWFYSGQSGPWTVKCHQCKEVIYLYEDKDETQGTD